MTPSPGDSQVEELLERALFRAFPVLENPGARRLFVEGVHYPYVWRPSDLADAGLWRFIGLTRDHEYGERVPTYRETLLGTAWKPAAAHVEARFRAEQIAACAALSPEQHQ